MRTKECSFANGRLTWEAWELILTPERESQISLSGHDDLKSSSSQVALWFRNNNMEESEIALSHDHRQEIAFLIS